LEWFQATQAPVVEKAPVPAPDVLATKRQVEADPFDWDLSATLGRDLADSISMPFLDEDALITPARASAALNLPQLDDRVRLTETTEFLSQMPQGTSPPYSKLEVQTDPTPQVPKSKTKPRTKLSKHAKPFAVQTPPFVTETQASMVEAQIQLPPTTQSEKAAALGTTQPRSTARSTRHTRPKTPDSDSSIDGFLERWKDARSTKGTQKAYVDLSDDSTTQSDSLNFTLRGGRGERAGRARAGKVKSEHPSTGIWAKFVAFIALIFSFIAAVGDAISEGASAFWLRLGAGSRRHQSKGRRSPSPISKAGREVAR